MKHKLTKGILTATIGSAVGIIAMIVVVIIALLMMLDFFGTYETDNYIENNMYYADAYKLVLNVALKDNKGYIPLTRILYFYLEDDSLSFYEIYVDNLDKETNKLLPISEVCELEKYKLYDGCKDFLMSGQIDKEQNKPFEPPIDFKDVNVTSFFMEEREVFGVQDVHFGWDFATSNQTPVKAVCDGKIKKVDFTFTKNVTDISGGGGNQITLECEIDDEVTYEVLYAHLYPGSAKVKNDQEVSAGDIIAGVGTTGYSTGPHLHYEVSLDGNVVDGMSLIDFSEQEDYNNSN